MVSAVFGIGLTEMILIGLVILMLFSPRELPGMLKSVAKVYGSIRRTAEDFRSQVMDAEELREPIEEIRAAYHGTKQELMSAQDLARRELQRARSETMRAQQKLTELVREESRRKDPLPEPAKPAAPAIAAAAATSAAAATPAATAAATPATAAATPAATPSSAPLATASSSASSASPASPAPPASPVAPASVRPPPSPRPPSSRPPIPGAVASTRPFDSSPASDDDDDDDQPIAPPANDRSSDAA